LPLLEQAKQTRGLFALSSGNEPLPEPFSVPGIKEVSSALLDAINKNKKIAVLGDYDCDGICSTAILTVTLEMLGTDTLIRLPQRKEGYGIQPEQVKELAERGADVIVTVDNGVAAFKAVSAAKEMGIDILVTDHHEPKSSLPACLVANPKLPHNNNYREYSGAGVAYFLARALCKAAGKPEPTDLLDLVSLATIADVCPITGPNFTMARKGMLRIRENPRPGLRMLAIAAKTEVSQINGYAMGWQLGPRINAAGRLGDPMLAYKLITTKDEQEAHQIAQMLDKTNRERQELVKASYAECMEQYDHSDFPVIITQYPHGIAGIVAGRVAQTIKRPVIVGAYRDDGTTITTASGRSVGEFNLLGALNKCHRITGLPEKYGGHKQAAGLSIEPEDIPKIQPVLNQIAQSELKPEDMTEWVDIDGVIKRPLIFQEVEELDMLEPCGHENPAPVFAMSGPVEILKTANTWKLLSMHGMKFFVSSSIEVAEGQTVNVAVTPRITYYQGTKQISARVVDIKTTLITRKMLVKAYQEWCRGKLLEKNTDIIETIFAELGLKKKTQNHFTSLLSSETFREYGLKTRKRK
jgi:single-stranded-DNA-specific exonuclease